MAKWGWGLKSCHQNHFSSTTNFTKICGSIKSRVKFYFWIFPTVWKKVNWVWWQFVCLGAIALCWTQSDGSKCQFSTRNPTLIFQQSQNPDSGPHGSKIIVRLRPSKIIYSKNDPSEFTILDQNIRSFGSDKWTNISWYAIVGTDNWSFIGRFRID